MQKPRLVIVGPVLPFRGGIAQHTTLLSRALAKRCECLVLSYSRQYPRWLFPGVSDRDPAYLNYLEPGALYCIDSMNPLTWIAAAFRIRRFSPSLVLLPWWTAYWAPMYLVLATLLRWWGISLTLLCHNVVDHEQASWKRWLTRMVLRRGTRFVVHSRAELAALNTLVPGAAVVQQPHPIYDQFPEPVGTLPRRARLELLFYGFVRPYKGLDVLLNALLRLNDTDYFLTIAGEVWGDPTVYTKLIGQLNQSSRIELLPRYVSEAETALLFSRADLVVLPYRSATGSGVVPVAYRYGKPVLASNVGGLPDVVRHGETGYLVPPDQSAALAEAIAAMDPAGLAAMRPAIDTMVGELTWEALADKVCGVVESPWRQEAGTRS